MQIPVCSGVHEVEQQCVQSLSQTVSKMYKHPGTSEVLLHLEGSSSLGLYPTSLVVAEYQPDRPCGKLALLSR